MLLCGSKGPLDVYSWFNPCRVDSGAPNMYSMQFISGVERE